MTEESAIGHYGWNRQRPDWRDEQYRFSVPIGVALPSHFDLVKKMPPIWNQGNIGSCTAHGSLKVYVADRMKEGQPVFMPSRLFQYYNSRSMEGTIASDAGASVRDAIKAIAQWGACDESLWPYVTSKFTQKPPDNAYSEAVQHQSLTYRPVAQNLYAIKTAIFQGTPVTFGFTVYQNFETNDVDRKGLMSMPRGSAIGGHCVVACGWNSKNYTLCANSWSTSWGDPDFPGYFWMPPDYIIHPQLASDFWIIETTKA